MNDEQMPVTGGAEAAAEPTPATKGKKCGRRLSKAQAAVLKDSLERNQIGAPPAGDSDTPKKKGRKPKGEQLTLPGAEVKLDKVGKAAERLHEALVGFDDATEEKGEAISNLIRAMKTAKRHSIKVHGYLFEWVHKGPEDKIKVQKPK